MTDHSPQVSVILPVYNAELYLREAIDSMLNQTYRDFELLAVNDGSKDGSLEILTDYAKRDKRVIVIDQPNKGLVRTLNETIALARAPYIARMDSDDVSLPWRLEWQVEALRSNPKVVLVGGCFEVMNEFSEFQYLEAVATKDEDIRRTLHLYNPFAHGSVMFTKEAFISAGGYSDQVGPTEDFDLWCRLAHQGEVMGIAHSIFRWRQNPNGITHTNNQLMVQKTREYTASMWNDFPPVALSLTQMRSKGNWYVQQYGDRGAKIKKTILDNNCHIAIKMLKHGQVLSGMKQLLAVALVGRSGLHVTYTRLNNTCKSLVFDRH